ncbi:precorrin-3B synthase [Brunnivagina elsteri]|uniref:precorrin-3B synthase n=1 Tax=Brunnivagina elsteri TaxID=1247191 RepID=UPI001FECCF55|nr:precorrin-3B synthase [Calothrix elsteri]
MVPEVATCPGLFYATPAQDGILSRIRIPGGILDRKQCDVIADIAEQFGGGYVDVTNRANLQIREINTGINPQVLQLLQNVGLGSPNSRVDHIRNIMTSPTAGIDRQELIDTRPFVKAWDNYIATNPHLGELSAKFSVCFDGRGKIRVCDRPNDIAFVATLIKDSVYFRLHLSVGEKGETPIDVRVLVQPEECLPVLAALADVYLQNSNIKSDRKPRLREIIKILGIDGYLQEVESLISTGLFRSHVEHETLGEKYQHIGIHPQRQPNLFYIGVVLPLGRLQTEQLRRLAALATQCGSGTIRLTPWQNLLITDIPNQLLPEVEDEIAQLGLDYSPSNIKSAMVACSGIKGCKSAATDTKTHALSLVKHFNKKHNIHVPINIHFTGCEKSCAQHGKSDITLLGVKIVSENRTSEAYQIYVGDGEEKFGRELYQNVTITQLPQILEQILKMYQIHRQNNHESLGEFANRYAIAELKQLFSCVKEQN